MKTLRLLFSLCLMALFVQIAQAQVPHSLSVQIVVTVPDGTPVPDGDYDIATTFYDEATGGNALLTETQTVPVSGGLVNLTLDVGTLPFGEPYFLGLSINGGNELAPRLPLNPSAYALAARAVLGGTNIFPADGDVGIGTGGAEAAGKAPRAKLHVAGDVLIEDVPVVGDVFDILVIDASAVVKRVAPAALGGGAFNGMLNNIPLLIKDAQGVTQIQLNPDGTSTHSGLETFSGGIKSEGNFELDEADFRMIQDGQFLGGIRTGGPELDELEAGGRWRFPEILRALGGITAEQEIRMILEEQFVGGIIILPTTEPEDLEAQGKWRFKQPVHHLLGFVSEGNSQVNGTLMAEDIEAANELRAFLAEVTEITTEVARVTMSLDVDGLADVQELLVQGNGQVTGDFKVDGTLNANNVSANVKNFRIDHPLDPAGQYLIHTSVESPDMMTVYNGNVTLDADGAATVEMPSYFEALNKDFRYQLTAIGGFAPVYVAEEIAGNRFKVAGGTPGMKVSWQVTGVRHDPYAEAYRSPVEVEKPAAEQGTYLHPELYGASPAQHARRDGSDQR